MLFRTVLRHPLQPESAQSLAGSLLRQPIDTVSGLLKEGEKPASCYFADNDLIAIGAAEALREAGWRIPEDIALVGFDDLPACEYMTPALTTVSVPKQYMGEVADIRLVQLIEGENSLPLAIQVFTKLIKRHSV